PPPELAKNISSLQISSTRSSTDQFFPLLDSAPLQHPGTHVKQRLQRFLSILIFFPASFAGVMAPAGHACIQAPHMMHRTDL
ncbi:MAG TPA: hypothetical protein PKV62_01430, partial [Oscillospiraceae bacterium]|nr:hypothetical protein [Oscillospiraceae bacterium]